MTDKFQIESIAQQYYHICFFTLSNGIATLLAFECLMPYTETCRSVSGVGLYCGVCLYWDVTSEKADVVIHIAKTQR